MYFLVIIYFFYSKNLKFAYPDNKYARGSFLKHRKLSSRAFSSTSISFTTNFWKLFFIFFSIHRKFVALRNLMFKTLLSDPTYRRAN